MDGLYDLKSDPYEMANLTGQPATRQVLVRMRSERRHPLKRNPPPQASTPQSVSAIGP